MNKHLFFLILFILSFCSFVKSKEGQFYQKTTISGKVLNFDQENKGVKLNVNMLGFKSLEVSTDIDNQGCFSTSFDLYIPTDVWLAYKQNFLILIHPGDSIYVEFDGGKESRPDLLKTIRFGGSASKINQEAAAFQQMYFSNVLYNDWDAKSKAIKEYDPEQYTLHLDTLKNKAQKIYNQFVTEVLPKEETKIWAQTFIEEFYYDALAFYPYDHSIENGLSEKEWNVPLRYFNPLTNRLPINRSILISGYAMSGFINRYHYHYARRHTLADEGTKKYIFDDGSICGLTEVIDSIFIYQCRLVSES